MRMMKKLMGVVAALVMVMSMQAYAQTPTSTTSTTTANQTCTDFSKLKTDANNTSSTKGILSNVSDMVKSVVGDASKKLFETFTNNANYKSAVNAAMILMVTIYGLAFTIGVVQASFAEVLKRLIKMGIIFAVISPTGWQFFSQYVVTFFNDGTDELIGMVISIGTGQPMVDGSPFIALDRIASVVISPDMIIAVIGSTFASGPYGLTMGALLGFAVMGLLKLLIDALKAYALSFIVRAMMFGVAPIFIVFLLFDKTKQLFTGWLNTLISLSLKPILFFTFLSFFLVILKSSATGMVGDNELCWVESKAIEGTQNKMGGWVWKKENENLKLEQWTWQGPLSCMLNGGKDAAGKPCESFPINILDILSFLILVYVAGRFTGVIDRLSNDISNTAINLTADARQSLMSAPPPEKASSKVNPSAGKVG
jgi:type IV secretory pathway VirB6-like protein